MKIEWDRDEGRVVDVNAIIKKWENKYKVTRKPEPFDPTRIKLACSKCKLIRTPLHRHHKGCDFTFAYILPDAFASRYLEFHPDDCDKLCEPCHNNFHMWIRPFRNLVLQEVELRKAYRLRITAAWCRTKRAELRRLYDVWLKRSH